MAFGGIQIDVLHVVDLAAKVFALRVLLFLELAEHQPLLLERLDHSSAVSVQALLVEQELGCKRMRRAGVLWDLSRPPRHFPFLEQCPPAAFPRAV